MTKLCAYFDMGPGTAPVYAGKRLPDFFKETQWQYPLDLSYHSTEAYAHDLGGRIKWQSATRTCAYGMPAKNAHAREGECAEVLAPTDAAS